MAVPVGRREPCHRGTQPNPRGRPRPACGMGSWGNLSLGAGRGCPQARVSWLVKVFFKGTMFHFSGGRGAVRPHSKS